MCLFRQITLKHLLYLSMFFLVSCAPEVTFFVTRQPKLPIENITTISMGTFTETLKQPIELPPPYKNRSLNTKSAMRPPVARFLSNKSAAGLVRATVVAGISKSNQYRIINTGGDDSGFSGVIPDRNKTGVISAKVKYFETSIENSEATFFNLIATRQGRTLQESLAMMAAKEAAMRTAQSSKGGFNVLVPYVEITSAMEVEFDFTRLGSGEKIIPTQIIRTYFTKKWGGYENTSHVPGPLRQVIITKSRKNDSFSKTLKKQFQEIELAFLDPDTFLAMGGKLKSNPVVPYNSIEIQTRLAKTITDRYIRLISPYTAETTLEVASGDSIAVNYIKGNAYELAINRLENVERSEEDSFNLGLSYESIGEYRQASKYYQEALEEDPENESYQKSLKRVGKY